MAHFIQRLPKSVFCTAITRNISTSKVTFGVGETSLGVFCFKKLQKIADSSNVLRWRKLDYNDLSTHSRNMRQKADPPLEEFRLIYEGPLSRKIKYIKWLSLSTATLSIVAAPVFILRGKESVPFIGKMILATTVITMGVTTTLLLHWLTKVYIHKMFFHPQTRTFAAETYNFIGWQKLQTFSVEDIVIPEVENVFSTFEANGRKYFVHMDLKEAEQILKYVREYNAEQLQ